MNEKRACSKCGGEMAEYEVSQVLVEGRFFYCSKFGYDHPWRWEKVSGEVKIVE